MCASVVNAGDACARNILPDMSSREQGETRHEWRAGAVADE